MIDKNDLFKQSGVLKRTIDKHNWNLYHTPVGVSVSWEDLERAGPTTQFEMGYNYLFAPVPQKGQTLREAYSITKGLGPSLLIDPNWEGIEEVYRGQSSIEREDEILFSRLWFPNPRVAIAISPKTEQLFDPSAVSIKLTHLVEAFQKYFRIVSPEDYVSQTSVISA